MKNIITLTILLFFGLFFSQCTDKVDLFDDYDANNQKKEKLIDVFTEVISANSKGSLFVESHQANFGREETDKVMYLSTTCQISSPLVDNQISWNDNRLPFKAGMEIYKDNINFDSIFGQENNIKIEGGNSRNESIDVNLYIPPVFNSVNLANDHFLSSGKTITWNADPLNTDGVYIWISYSPLENSDLAEVEPDRRDAYIVVPDNGSYTFNLADFSGIPNNSTVFIKLLRGSFVLKKLSNNSDEVLRVIAVNKSEGFAKLQ